MDDQQIQDTRVTIQSLKDKLLAFREKRGWKNEDPKDVALSLILEASELLEHFQWKSGEEVREEARLFGPICDELADVLWWVLVMALRLDIDVAQAFERKMAYNDKKYPAEQFGDDKTPDEKRRAYYAIKAKYRGSHPLAENEE
jgi:NTP pyrophosphatase (non-canonical NTP hydrolase)